ncbi:colicin immunity domain-containing protein [Sphaerisporangium sp. NPDC051011]|uniref:colicin immunity domain-containing protein n=1 Tax=Sphaerisporangium sp. NPDC051011 TaxID=3155792 RepID=UPI0033EEB80B
MKNLSQSVVGYDNSPAGNLFEIPARIFMIKEAGSPSVVPMNPEAWSRPSDVEPGTGVAEQLYLMRQFAGGRLSAPDFASAWLAARRRVLAGGERLRKRFDRVLTNVFYQLDDYAIDPALREPGDMTDADLKQYVQGALDDLDALEGK